MLDAKTALKKHQDRKLQAQIEGFSLGDQVSYDDNSVVMTGTLEVIEIFEDGRVSLTIRHREYPDVG